MLESHHARLDSTHAQAKRDLRAADQPLLVSANEQTHAVGRDGGRWHAPRGGSWFSLVWPTHLEAEVVPTVALFASYAALRACRRAISLSPAGSACSLEIKWPNDVLLNNQKVAGTLVEVVDEPTGDSPRALVISVGINVSMPTDALPENAGALPATTLSHAADGQVEPADLTRATAFDLVQLLESFERYGADRGIVKAIESRLAWLGDPVSVMADKQRVEGICRGLDSAGRLQLETSEGLQAVNAGDVERLRPLDHLDTWYSLRAHMPTSDASRG